VGDDAWERFARDHAGGLLRYAVLLAPVGVDPQDLVQECLVRIAPRVGRLSSAEAVAYGRRVITNLVIDQQRRASRSRVASRLLGPPRPEPLLDERVSERDAVTDLVGSLPTRQRAAVVLRYWAGLSDHEIAATLGCSVGTVKSQISRALAALRTRTDPALRLGGTGE
jgi:RNA polymerase sigma-70 factor (sigma-E family)